MEPTGMKLCMVCAWRRECKKKHKYEASSRFKCVDFTRDVTIPEEKEKEEST